MDHISRIEIFLKVAEFQSFSETARHFGMTSPAIGKQINNLEEALGVKLLYRTTRLISLTEEGALYYERTKHALENIRETEEQLRDLKNNPSGMLKVNMPMSFGKAHLLPVIAEFAEKYPDITLETHFEDRKVDMLAEGFDAVIRIAELEDSSLRMKKIADCPIYLCASPAFIKMHDLKNIDDLPYVPSIIYSKYNDIVDWRYQDENGKIGKVRLKKYLSADNAEMMLEACLRGIGAAILPAFIAEKYLRDGTLIQLFPENKTYPQRYIHILYPDNKFLPSKLRLFIDHIYEARKNWEWA